MPKYEAIFAKLQYKYPLYFEIVGRNGAQNATDLFNVIKNRISASSHAIFDATGNNANVSLEFGYAEGIDVPRSIFLSGHKASNRNVGSAPILSDLIGMRRVHYKTAETLSLELHRFCREHEYTKRFEGALNKILRGEVSGAKKSGRALALRLIHAFDGQEHLPRERLVEHVKVQNYPNRDIESMLVGLRASGILKYGPGRWSFAAIV